MKEENCYDIKFDPRTLKYVEGSNALIDVLSVLGELQTEYEVPESIIIVGGFVRSLMRYNIGATRTFEKIRDIDIILPHHKELSEDIDNLLDREQEIRKALADILNLEVMPFDAEPLMVKKNQPIKPIIFGISDLTINKVYMCFDKSSNWYIRYKKNCWRDNMNKLGIINPHGPKMTRIDHGRIIPSNHGFYRLMRAWALGRIVSAYLPEWQLDAHFRAIEKTGQKPLGNYLSLIAMQNENENPDIQNRWIKILRRLGFTTLKTFDELIDQAYKDKRFIFKDKPPFKQHINDLIRKAQERLDKKKERETKRNLCYHEFQTFPCNACGHNKCVIQECKECDKFILPKGGLRCNRDFGTANLKAMPKKDIISL